MGELYFYLLVVIEALTVLGVIATALTKSPRASFIIGFNTLLPVTAIIVAFGEGALWRQVMILGFVLIYLIRMNWVLFVWYNNTAASKLDEQLPPAALYALPVVLTNTFGWLYCLPFFWAVDRAGPFDGFDAAAITVYILGTVFHLGSDYQKRRFKLQPDSPGKILKTGFWGMSRHPNYFGDFLIYVSFALVSASPWGLIAPLANALQYFFDAIPKSEKMSSERYGAAWREYRERVRCFIPYLA
jgi:steroid 5-alpha reductase family enzyme